MDEIEWLKNTKKALILMTRTFLIFGILMLTLMLIRNAAMNEWEYIGIDLLVVFCIIVPMPLLMAICYIILCIGTKAMNSGRKVINFDKNYIRDIPKNCSPAIASLIYDLKIDVYKDYTATILYLCAKKYINLKKKGNSYSLNLGEQTDYSKLGRCEKYVLDTIINKSKFDENQFKLAIVKEAQEKQLITDKMHDEMMKWIFIIAICFIICFISYKINWYLFVLCVSVFPACLYGYWYGAMYTEHQRSTEYIRTKKGKEVALMLSGLKKYIKEYTLIKEKEIDYVQILEEYIPYAISLDEADTIKEFIKYNKEYRSLIYNKKIDKSQ